MLNAWREFLCGKRKRKDVARFYVHFTDNIVSLHKDLANKSYCHGSYHSFKINDPKPRDIHKASVRDRIVHRAIYRVLLPYFDRKFIFDSHSCRDDKGTHLAMNRFREYGRKVSKNNTRTVWVLKGDIRKFFASIDHNILKEILKRQIKDEDILWLLAEVIDSFHTKDKPNIGLPLGNLTSQLLVNIYLNEFDQFIKRQLKIHYYVRYADDFVVINESRLFLENIISPVAKYLKESLKLDLHPDKLFIRTLVSGVDFLGWVHFTHHRVLRTATKRRMLRNLHDNKNTATFISYTGLLKHGDTHELLKSFSVVTSVLK